MTTRRRTIVAAVATAALLVGGTAVVELAMTPDLGIDLNLPTLDESVKSGYWYPVVVNDTGSAIEDATLDVSVDSETRERPDVIVGDSPDSVRNGHEDTVPATREKCRVPATDDAVEEEPAVFDDDGASSTAFQIATSVGCDQDLAAGNNVYSLWIGSSGESDGDLYDGYTIAVTVKAELKADGKTLASVEEKLTIAPDPRLHSITVEGVPDTVPADRAPSNPFGGRITIANKTGEDVEDAAMTMVVDPYSGIGLKPSGTSCDLPETESGRPTTVACDDLDIPAGESIVVKVKVYAIPEGFDEERMKRQKLYIKVGTDAGAVGKADIAKKSRQIWLDDTHV